MNITTIQKSPTDIPKLNNDEKIKGGLMWPKVIFYFKKNHFFFHRDFRAGLFKTVMGIRIYQENGSSFISL